MYVKAGRLTDCLLNHTLAIVSSLFVHHTVWSIQFGSFNMLNILWFTREFGNRRLWKT